MSNSKLQQLHAALARCQSICAGVHDDIAIMATLSCELYHGVDGFDWVGFYRVTAPQRLTIGPYQGGHGCLYIDFDRGVCGAAARQGQVQLVDDVNAFDGHIACASSTQSELVIPVYQQQRLIAVLDIDSDQHAFFDPSMVAPITSTLESLFHV